MNRASSAASCAATGWRISRQWTSSVPSALVSAGNVPGIRLASAQNASRASPGGRRGEYVTKPGWSGSRGSSARRATSTPAITAWIRKRNASLAKPNGDTWNWPGGSRRRLTKVAPVTAAAAAGRSPGSIPARASQSTRNPAARTRALRSRSPASFAIRVHQNLVTNRRLLNAEPRHVERRQEDQRDDSAHQEATHDGKRHRPPEDGRGN